MLQINLHEIKRKRAFGTIKISSNKNFLPETTENSFNRSNILMPKAKQKIEVRDKTELRLHNSVVL